jgi:hypothetical protein
MHNAFFSQLNCQFSTNSIDLSIIISAELSYITTDGQSANLSWYQAPIWGL